VSGVVHKEGGIAAKTRIGRNGIVIVCRERRSDSSPVRQESTSRGRGSVVVEQHGRTGIRHQSVNVWMGCC
jgi:hypothetical protein